MNLCLLPVLPHRAWPVFRPMPRRSGWELAKLVRRIGDDVQPRPLLIAVSGHYNKSSDRILTTMAGFDHFFAKPVDPQALIGLVNRYRERRG